VRREVLRDGRPWCGVTVHVVADEPGLLATYICAGAPLEFPPGPWPTPDGLHPWSGNPAWRGHGVLMLQRPGEAHAVWHFWTGPDRDFAGWYINLQEPFRRTSIGYDTQDLELDIQIYPDGNWNLKDEEFLDVRVAEGRFTPAMVESIRAQGKRLTDQINRGESWWDPSWAEWSPDPDWGPVGLPQGWSAVPAGLVPS
jgi:hypothetical protein